MTIMDTTVIPNVPVNVSEIGPALTLPDGRVFLVGGTGHSWCQPYATWNLDKRS